ncbi:MAG: hypothetical protein ACRD8O_16285 [Bryobacteraceae bacterium]
MVKEVFSESREWFVRVSPGKSVGDTLGFAGASKGPYAKAEFYRRQADLSYRLVSETALANPVAPVDFFVTNRGFLATLDNWHNMGYGKAVAFYSPDGKTIRANELKDLFSAEEIAAFSHSVSSIWWRQKMAHVRGDQISLYVMLDAKGGEIIFETETGAWQVCQWRGDKHLCRSTNTHRRWIGFAEPERF